MEVRFGEDRARQRSLERERGERLRDVFDLHVEPRRVVLEPAQVRLRRGDAELVLAQARDRAVVEHLAGGVAPRRIGDLADLQAADFSRHHQIEEAGGVLAAHAVLAERRDVEQRRRAADRMVFALVRELVGARHHVARPAPPGMARAERGGTLVEGSGLQQKLDPRAGLCVEVVRVLRAIA